MSNEDQVTQAERLALADECEKNSSFFSNASVPSLREILKRASTALRALPRPPTRCRSRRWQAGGIIERLRNPMWSHSNAPFESPQLDKEENLAAMREAADLIERLSSAAAAQEDGVREALEPFAQLVFGAYGVPSQVDSWEHSNHGDTRVLLSSISLQGGGALLDAKDFRRAFTVFASLSANHPNGDRNDG